MKRTRVFLLLGLISFIGILISCIKAPRKETSPNGLAPVESSGAVQSSDNAILTEDQKLPSGNDPLAALHTGQKSCVACHEKDRPAPPHVAKEDCVACHSYPSFKNVQAFSHIPKPPTCENCHARPTTVGLQSYPNQGPPAGFDPNNKNAPGSGHYVGKDCGTCHATPNEGAASFVFSHSAPKPGICLPCHFNDGRGEHDGDDDVMLLDFGNCSSCHQNYDRNATRNFDANEN